MLDRLSVLLTKHRGGPVGGHVGAAKLLQG